MPFQGMTPESPGSGLRFGKGSTHVTVEDMRMCTRSINSGLHTVRHTVRGRVEMFWIKARGILFNVRKQDTLSLGLNGESFVCMNKWLYVFWIQFPNETRVFIRLTAAGSLRFQLGNLARPTWHPPIDGVFIGLNFFSSFLHGGTREVKLWWKRKVTVLSWDVAEEEEATLSL